MNLKSSLIPSHWKEDIDKTLEKKLLNANRYFAETNPFLINLIGKTLEDSPKEFYDELTSRWNWHHLFYEKYLEPAVHNLLEKEVTGITPKQIDQIIHIFPVMSIVDQATLVYSAAIKKYIQYQLDKRRLNELELSLVITPERKSFFVQYQIDHISYKKQLKENASDAEITYKKLLHQYHGGDEKILQSRLKKFEWLNSLETTEISDILTNLNTKVASTSTYADEDLKYLNMIITYDNYDEYLILKTFIGISGFVLRDYLLNILNKSKVLINDGSLYSLKDQEILTALNALKKLQDEYMFKNVKGYVQNGLTCSATCLMMALNYYGLCSLDARTESRIHDLSSSIYTIGEHYSGIAKVATEYGLEAVLIHSENAMFTNAAGLMSANMFELLMKEYSGYINNILSTSFSLLNGINFDEFLIREYLKNDYLVILAGQLSNGILHSKIVVGYQNENFYQIDPLEGAVVKVKPAHLIHFSKTQIGSWMLAVRRKQAPINELINELLNFQTKAKNYLIY